MELRDDTARARALLAASRTFRTEDFAAAIRLLREIGGVRNRGNTAELRDGLLCDWVARDLASAREWLKGQSPDEWRWLEDGRHAWLRADPRGCVSWLRGLDNVHFQQVGLDDHLCEVDPEAALELSQRKGGPGAARAFGALARRDPQATAERVLNLPANWERASAVAAVAAAWAGSDREAALDWASQLDDAALATKALNGIVTKLIESAPPAAARFIAEHPGVTDDSALNRATQRWAARDESAALNWARSVVDSAQRRVVLESVIESMARHDARAAADLWTAENAAGGGKLGHLDTVAAALASTAGPNEALRFIDAGPAADRGKAEDAIRKTLAGNRGWEDMAEIARGMPPGARRTEWLAEAAKFFAADGDLPRAERFASSLAGAERKAALLAVGGLVLADDFDARARIIVNTGDRPALVAALRGRFAQDGGRLRSWLARTPLLTAEEKAHLLAPLPPPASPQ